MIRKTIRDHKHIIFNGNGYDDSWIKEATEKRGLMNLRTTPDAIPHILDKKERGYADLTRGIFRGGNQVALRDHTGKLLQDSHHRSQYDDFNGKNSDYPRC